MKKIKKVGLQDIGTIIIDHFSKEGKKNIFKKILKKYKPEEVLCIGDNIQSEIFTANKLGMHTIRILKGKRKKLIRRNKYEKPEFTVKKLMEILGVNKEDILFVGDRLFEGGNDYPVKLMGIDTIAVSGFEETPSVIRKILSAKD